jgi:hypothetical protein
MFRQKHIFFAFFAFHASCGEAENTLCVERILNIPNLNHVDLKVEKILLQCNTLLCLHILFLLISSTDN